MSIKKGWMRRILFWLFDFLRGATIWKHYKDVKIRNTSKCPNVDQLNKILQWSTTETEFYKDFDPNDINSFPVLTKKTLREQWDSIIARPYVGLKTHSRHTSGSTGIPLHMIWNKEKRHRQIAEMIYYYEVAGQKFGQCLMVFSANHTKDKKHLLIQWLKNIYEFDAMKLDRQKMDKIFKRLSSRPLINCFIAYGSFHEELLHYLEMKEEINFPVNSIITVSEVLSMNSKEKLAKITKAKVFDRYSNEENGFLAQSSDCSDVFDVNLASFYIEILKLDSDEPADDGEIGRIVITDLFNYAVPLIRYDTGDLSTRSGSINGWTSSMKTIHGRQSDVIFDTKGAKVTTSSWNIYMDAFPLIKQYQFIQNNEKEYCLKVNGARDFYSDDSLIEAIKKAIGDDASVTIEHVEGIQALSSGKFKKTICNYNPNLIKK